MVEELDLDTRMKTFIQTYYAYVERHRNSIGEIPEHMNWFYKESQAIVNQISEKARRK